MKEKFQKFFGSQTPMAESALPSFADDVNEAVQQRRIDRITTRRRVLGLLALVLLVLVLAPAFFEPDMATADRTALTVIPPMKGVTPDMEVAVKPATDAAKDEPAVAPTVDEKSVRSTAKALSAANPVSAGTLQAPGLADGEPADPIGVLLDKTPAKPAKAEVNQDVKPAAKAEKAPEKTLAKVEFVKTAKSEKPAAAKPAAVVKTALTADPNGRWYIQIFATANKAAAENKARQLTRQGLPSYTEPVKRRGTDLWRVRVGRFATMNEAKAARDILANLNESNGGISQLAPEKK